MRPNRSALIGSLVGVSLCAAFVACSSNATNPTPVYNVGHDAGDAKRSDTGTTPPHVDAGVDARLTHDAAVDAIGDAFIPPDVRIDVNLIDGSVVDGAECTTGDGGCWRCEPTTPPEFLNQCTSSQCSPYDNAAHLPAYDGGGLAPLGS